MADEDPRRRPHSPERVPDLLRSGAAEFDAGRFWHAHEDWETAWHALRAVGRAEEADFVQGLILVAAGFENAKRGKEAGFRRQTAKGLLHLRRHRAFAPAFGVRDGWIEAATDYYLEGARHLRLAAWPDAAAPRPPALALR